MSEIGKSDISKINANYNTQMLGKNNSPIEEKAERAEIREFNNPGAEAVGRAMINPDNLDNDIKKIIEAPSILDDSETLYKAAEQVAMAKGATPEEAAAIAAGISTEGW